MSKNLGWNIPPTTISNPGNYSGNYFNAALRASLEKNPDLFKFDEKEFEARQKKMRAERDAANPARDSVHPDTIPRDEYNRLNQELFNLKQDAKAFETRADEAQGQIELIEQRINRALKLKKAAVDEGNLRGERTYEQAIQRMERELVEAQEEFTKARHCSAQAARNLKAFGGHGRMAELKKQLEQPLPDAKSVNVPK
jgi:hypothetical protein